MIAIVKAVRPLKAKLQRTPQSAHEHREQLKKFFRVKYDMLASF